MTTRWRLVISDYNSIRARLLNTSALEGTNLVLYNINETTLVKWYKNDVRRDEIRMLLQGLPPSQHQLTAEEDLPPAKELPSVPPSPPALPHVFEEAEDTSGQATCRKKTKSSSRPPAPPSINLTLDLPLDSAPSKLSAHPPAPPSLDLPLDSAPAGPSAPQSRTTAWRHKKEREEGKQAKTRKVYTCRVCGQPMTTEGHTQFRGQRYCPNAPGQLPQDEWLKRKKEEAARKKQGPPQ